MARGNFGLDVLIGGNLGQLQRALKDSEAAIRTSATRQEAITRELLARENRLTDTAMQARIRAARESAAEAGKAIKTEIADYKTRSEMLVRLARATSEEITRIKKAEAAKIEAGVRADMARESAAAAKAKLAAQGAAVDALASKYEHLAAVGDAFGLGLGGRIRTLTAHLGELRSSGLARTEAGMQALLSVERELTVATAALKLQVGALSATAAAGLGVAIGSAISEFANFEKSLNRFKALSDATGEQMERVASTAIALGGSTKFSAVEAADGLNELAAAGFTVEQALAAIPGVLAAAAADGMEVARAAEIVGATLNGFGLAADQAGRVSDILAQTARVSATSIGDMGESFRYASTLAAATSQSIEEVATDLAIMANAGVKGSQAGTTFRGAMSALLKPTDEAGALLEQLGISLVNTKGKMLPLSDVLAQLRDKTAKMGEAQRGAAVATIFGQEAMSGVLSVMKLTDTQMGLVTGQIRAYNGAAMSTADTMNKGVIPALDEAKGAFSTLGIAVGEGFAPAVVAVANGAQAIASSLASIDPSLRPLVTLAATAGVTFTGLAATITLLGPAALAAAAGLAVLTPAATVATIETAALAEGATAASVGVTLLGTSLRVALPWLGLTALAVGGVVAVMDQQARAAREAAAAQEKARQANFDAVTQNRLQGESLKALTAEHDKLAAKTNLTKEEKKRLAAIQVELDRQFPGLTEKLRLDKEQHWATAKAVDEVNRKLAANTAERIRNAEVMVQQARAAATLAAGDYKKTILARAPMENLRRDLSTSPEARARAGFTLGVNNQNLDTNARAIDRAAMTADSANKTLAQAEADLNNLKARAKPPKVDPVSSGRGPGYSDGKDPKVKGASGAANQAFQDAKAAAEAEAAFADSVAERGYAAARDTLKKRLALLEEQKTAGIRTEASYLREVEQVKLREVQLEAEASQLKLYVQRAAVEKELGAAKAAGKGKSDEAKALAGKLAVIDTQLAGVEDKRQAARLDINQQTNSALVASYAKAAADEKATLADLDGKRRASDKAMRDAGIARMTGSEKERAVVLATYQDTTDAAWEAWEAEEARAQAAKDPAIAKAIRDQAKATLDAARAGAVAKKELDLTDVAKKNTDAIKQMAASLVALAMDPSLERLANFARDFVLDQDKLGNVAGILGGALEASDKAALLGGSLAGAAASVGTLVGALGGPLPIALGAVSLLSGSIADEWKRAAEFAADMRDIQEELADLRAERDPEAERELSLRRNNDAREAKLAEIRTQVRSELVTASAVKAALSGSAAGAFAKAVTDADIDAAMQGRQDVADVLETFQRKAGKIWLDYDDKLADKAEEAADALKKSTEEATKALEASAKNLSESMEGVAATQERLLDAAKAIAKEREALDLGEENERGERISIEARRELDLEKERTGYAKKTADYRKEEAAARKAMAKIDEDERAAKLAILDEGIAVRAKTEYQDKSERIAAVEAEAAEKRKALDDEAKAREAERLDAFVDHDNAMARIRNQAQAKTDAHNAEIARLRDVERQNAVLLAQQASQLAFAIQIATLGGAVVSTRTTGSSSASGLSSGFSGGELTGKINPATGKKYHSGGVVAGVGEVPAVLKAGEMVLTENHQANLWDWINAVRAPQMASLPPGYGGGGTVNAPLTINIQAAPGQDGRELFRAMRPEMDAWLRRNGMGR